MKSSCYVRKNGRLALFKQQADAAWWDRQWLARSDETLKHALRRGGRMAALGRFFAKWIPREGVICEAGCGTGVWLRRLLDRGYDCVGLDYALDTLLRSKHVAPDLPFVGGDIFRLPFCNSSLAAYVSFGVVEHFEEGPRKALQEAYRVLRPGGVALISVPYENVLRREAPAVDEAVARKQGLGFYQYYFTHKAFLAELAAAGLRPQQIFQGYGVYIGLRGLGRLLRSVLSRLPKPSWWSPVLDMVPCLAGCYAHMMFTVAVKP